MQTVAEIGISALVVKTIAQLQVQFLSKPLVGEDEISLTQERVNALL